jgi:hypothetical protein
MNSLAFTRLSGLSNLTRVLRGSLVIQNNPNLLFAAMPRLKEVEGALVLYNNPKVSVCAGILLCTSLCACERVR